MLDGCTGFCAAAVDAAGRLAFDVWAKAFVDAAKAFVTGAKAFVGAAKAFVTGANAFAAVDVAAGRAGAGEVNVAAGLPKANGPGRGREEAGGVVLALVMAGAGLNGDADADGVLSPPGVEAAEKERAVGKREEQVKHQ